MKKRFPQYYQHLDSRFRNLVSDVDQSIEEELKLSTSKVIEFVLDDQPDPVLVSGGTQIREIHVDGRIDCINKKKVEFVIHYTKLTLEDKLKLIHKIQLIKA